MAPGETVVVTIRVLATQAGPVENVAGVTTPRAEANTEAALNVVAAEEEFVPEAGSLLLLGSGALSLAGYAATRRRKQ